MRRERPGSFAGQVYRLVRRVPPGRVVSYGAVAAMLGAPRAARGVGRALGSLSDGTSVPWWRVVNRNGEISIKGAHPSAMLQRMLLEAEGIRFDRNGRIDWKRWGWNPDARDQPPTVVPS